MIFDELLQAEKRYNDYDAELKSALADAQKIYDTVKKRIDREMRLDQERVLQLEAEANEATPTGRIAQAELSRLKQKVYTVTDEEEAAFSESIELAKESFNGMRQIVHGFERQYDDARKEVDRLRVSIPGNFQAVPRSSWIDGKIQDFRRLRGE